MSKHGPDAIAPEDLPKLTKGDYIVLMPRDPEWLHAYWEISEKRYKEAASALGTEPDAVRPLLRVHNVTKRIDSETGRPRLEESEDFLSVEVSPSTDHWYVKVSGANQLYCAEYVVAAPDGRTETLAQSNLAATPSDRVSDVTEETWAKAGAEAGAVVQTRGPARTKWLAGHEAAHEALSSAGSAALAGDEEQSRPRS